MRQPVQRDTAEHWALGWKPKCDACGRFIAIDDFDKGAERYLATPDSEFTSEEYVTLCIKHARPSASAPCPRCDGYGWVGTAPDANGIVDPEVCPVCGGVPSPTSTGAA